MRALFAALLFVAHAAQAQSWSVEAIETRSGVRANLAMHAVPSGPARHVVLALLASGTSSMQAGATTIRATGPWARGADALAQSQVALAYLDAPSDAAGRTISQRPADDVRMDVQAAVDVLRKRHPGVPLHLGAFAANGAVLDSLVRVQGVTRIVVASGSFADDRERTVRPGLPILFVHAATSQCDSAPLLEAEQVARAAGQVLVRVGYPKVDETAGCGSESQHTLRGREPEFARLVVDWLDGREVPREIGELPARIAWDEQVLHYETGNGLGRTRHELTLLRPDAPGNVPVVVFNHGDIDLDHPSVRWKRRVRDMTVAREFLRLGVAVAMPARRGVGLSGGVAPRNFGVTDGDPTFKARVQGEDIRPAVEFVRTLPGIDPDRVVLAGHSAGGYSATWLATTGIPGVIGLVNFSGGRTDLTTAPGAAPGTMNATMVQGFAQMGQAAKVPALFIFGEGDSRYSVQTIRASHAAYVDAGGKATLVLAPARVGRDGHQVQQLPDNWREALRTFLVDLAVVR